MIAINKPTDGPWLHDYDYVMVNSSGGKDSQTALREVVRTADAQGYPRERIVVVHADLGRMEWKGVKSLARRQAEHYGLEFHVVNRRNADGNSETLLDYVRRRRKWPSSTTRYCTSDFKRTPCSRVLTALGRRAWEERGQRKAAERQCRILNVFGFRSQESPARAKRERFCLDNRASTKERADGTRAREVHDWLPIHDWSESQVWADIEASGVPYHVAYDLGMPRLSCCFCIFAPKAALMCAGKHNPELLDEYVQVEREIGHDFRQDTPLRDIKAALERGETAGTIDNWTM